MYIYVHTNWLAVSALILMCLYNVYVLAFVPSFLAKMIPSGSLDFFSISCNCLTTSKEVLLNDDGDDGGGLASKLAMAASSFLL